MINPACYFARIFRTPCDGPLDLCHLIPKQRLKKADVPDDAIWDERIVVNGCRRHHHRFDQGFDSLGRNDLPPGVAEYAAEHDLTWSLDRDFPAIPEGLPHPAQVKT